MWFHACVCVLSDTLIVFFQPQLLLCVIVVKGVSWLLFSSDSTTTVFFGFFCSFLFVGGFCISVNLNYKGCPSQSFRTLPLKLLPTGISVKWLGMLLVGKQTQRASFSPTHIYTHTELLVYQLQRPRQCVWESNQIECSSHFRKWFKQLVGFNWLKLIADPHFCVLACKQLLNFLKYVNGYSTFLWWRLPFKLVLFGSTFFFIWQNDQRKQIF